jgi:hypothetical protein
MQPLLVFLTSYSFSFYAPRDSPSPCQQENTPYQEWPRVCRPCLGQMLHIYIKKCYDANTVFFSFKRVRLTCSLLMYKRANNMHNMQLIPYLRAFKMSSHLISSPDDISVSSTFWRGIGRFKFYRLGGGFLEERGWSLRGRGIRG